jgi:bacteriorhodopsin
MNYDFIVKDTLHLSFFVQIITLIFGLLIVFLTNVSSSNRLIREALILENGVQIIEGSFYIWFIYFYTKNVDKEDIASYRYYDWFFSTPLMIISTVAYFHYNNTKLYGPNASVIANASSSLYNFIKTDIAKISELLFYNFNMLFLGYLQELKLISLTISTIFGFLFLGLLFLKMFVYYVKNNSANYLIFYLMLFIWSLYGIAALYKNKIKNASYNILDVFSKNFFGLFLAYLVYNA